jgi:hypothetical protein
MLINILEPQLFGADTSSICTTDRILTDKIDAVMYDLTTIKPKKEK